LLQLETVREEMAKAEQTRKKLAQDLARELGHEHEIEDDHGMFCVAVGCSGLQRVAVRCSVLRCVVREVKHKHEIAVGCNGLQWVAACRRPRLYTFSEISSRFGKEDLEIFGFCWY